MKGNHSYTQSFVRRRFFTFFVTAVYKVGQLNVFKLSKLFRPTSSPLLSSHIGSKLKCESVIVGLWRISLSQSHSFLHRCRTSQNWSITISTPKVSIRLFFARSLKPRRAPYPSPPKLCRNTGIQGSISEFYLSRSCMIYSYTRSVPTTGIFEVWRQL